MWRCQREKLKEDAIQCCGEKQCEQIYLDSFPEGFDLILNAARVDRQLHYYADFKNHQFYSKWRSNGNENITLNGQSFNNKSTAGSYDWVTTFNYSLKFKNEDPYWYLKISHGGSYYYLYQNGKQSLRGGNQLPGGYDCFEFNWRAESSNNVYGTYFNTKVECRQCGQYGCNSAYYTQWQGPDVQLSNGTLHIWFDDEHHTGASTFTEGLSAHIEYMGNKYNCKYSQNYNHYYPYDLCDSSGANCGNGMPASQALKICKKDFETKFFEWTERDYSIENITSTQCGQYGCKSESHNTYTQLPDVKKSGIYKADCSIVSYSRYIDKVPAHYGFHGPLAGTGLTVYRQYLSCPEDPFFIDRTNYE